MEECMRDSMRKLALWLTRTFKPMMTHDELEPIMATLGFVGLPPSSPATAAGTAWKEYAYTAAMWRTKPVAFVAVESSLASPPQQPPRPRLPYPRIDGLHLCTYRAFIDAVNFYLEMCDISDLFHIRGMPLHKLHDRNRKWGQMEQDESVFVYREGTLDQSTQNFYKLNKHNTYGYNSIVMRSKGNNAPISCLVPLEDIIV